MNDLNDSSGLILLKSLTSTPKSNLHFSFLDEIQELPSFNHTLNITFIISSTYNSDAQLRWKFREGGFL